MRRVLTILALAALLAPMPALGQVVSERPESVSIVVYPQLFGVGLVMVTETRTVDLPAGPSRIEFRGVADQIVPQTVALQGLPEDVAEQNFDYQLLTRGSLIRQSEGRTVSLVRTNPVTGEVTEERARVVSGSQGAVLDIGGRIEALQCSALPERLVFDDLPPGFVAKPTLSVETISPRAERAQLMLSYLATGVSWQANYVASLADDGETLDLSSWITISNQSETAFADAPVQVIAGRLQRSSETRAVQANSQPFYPNCWQISSGRFVGGGQGGNQDGVQTINLRGMGAGRDIVLVNGVRLEAAAPAPAPPAVEDLGDYKLYTLPEPTTLAARQTKQLLLFDRQDVAFDRVYRQTFSTTFEGGRTVVGSPAPASIVLELKNESETGLGLALPQGSATVFEPAADGTPILTGQPSIRDTAVDLPFELALSSSMNVWTERRVLRRDASDIAGGGQDNGAEVEVVLTNAGAKPAQVQVREQGGRANLTVDGESHPHTLKDGNLQWQITVPAGGSVTLSYSLSWRT